MGKRKMLTDKLSKKSPMMPKAQPITATATLIKVEVPVELEERNGVME